MNDVSSRFSVPLMDELTGTSRLSHGTDAGKVGNVAGQSVRHEATRATAAKPESHPMPIFQ